MEQMISNLGFPITSAVGIAFYFVQKDKATREDKNKIIDKLIGTIEKFDSKLDRFATVLESNNNRLENIECDIRNIKEKVGE